MLFINVNAQEKAYGTSYFNKEEAHVALNIVKYFFEKGL
jgi:hypothetical protein